MNHNMKSVRIETPIDINEEVKCILTAAKKNQSQQQQQSDHPRILTKLRTSTNISTGAKDLQPHNFITSLKFLTSQSYDTDISNVTFERQERRAPAYPEVQLLNDPRPVDTKPIGFRPSWKCET